MTTDKKDLEKISQKYVNICRELNMDKETEQKSWKIYQEIIKTHNLDGEPTHWLCCALYAACRDSYTPTVGTAGSVIKGNCVSLTKLLRSCQISISEFLNKIRKWVEYTKLSGFVKQIERLERSFGISYVLYQKYNETYHKMFLLNENDRKNKKSKPGVISSSMLYEFCWCLFLTAKSEDPNHTLDIVTSFHFLLCGMDLIYLCVLREKRTDLLNPTFAELLKTKNNSNEVDKDFHILYELCRIHDAQYLEAKDIKMYSFKSIMEKFIKNKILQGNDKKFLDILSPQYFDYNNKSVNNSYEQYVLSIGEIDERILLSNTNIKQSNDIDLEKSIKTLIPCTPFTRRHHLPNKETSEPISNATQNVKKLKAFNDCYFSKDFLVFLDQRNICKTKIEERLSRMCNTFCEKYPSKYEGTNKFNLAKGVYYNLLEKITISELRNKPGLRPQILLENETLHSTLIACCVEIVMAAYNSDVKFPWILKCFDIQALNFYKIIEIVVMRHEDILTRTLIIHLNTIEEKCLDYLAWKSTSPLWNAMRQLNGVIPPWSSVENRINANIENINSRQANLSPIDSAYECFNHSSGNPECARRDLFNIGKAVQQSSQILSNNNSQNDGIVAANNQTQQHQTIQNGGGEDTPRKGIASIRLFLRKFYKLAYMRIHELCKELDLQDDGTLNKIWTIFEYSIVKKTELMRDRHLDQLIMCAIYVFIKITEVPGKTFTDIMKFYRNQPQAASNIYREVLIKPAIEKPNGEKEPPEYQDIINFYNNVYVPHMQSYVLSFGANIPNNNGPPRRINLLLSPHPPEKMMSPRKLTASHNLFIKTLEKSNVSQSPIKFTFEIYKSPAKELEKINEHINGRRNLPFDNDELIVKKRRSESAFITKKIQDVIKERQSDEKN